MRLWIKLVLKPLWEPSILPFSSNPRRPRWREVPPNCLHFLFYPNYYLFAKWRCTRIIKMSQIVSLQELILFLPKMAFLVFCVGFFPRGSCCGLRWHYQFKGGRLIRRDHISLNWRKYHHRHHHHFLSGIPYLYENQKGAEKNVFTSFASPVSLATSLCCLILPPSAIVLTINYLGWAKLHQMKRNWDCWDL